ncbi:unnamed protein product [Chrysoparadoxa australica]
MLLSEHHHAKAASAALGAWRVWALQSMEEQSQDQLATLHWASKLMKKVLLSWEHAATHLWLESMNAEIAAPLELCGES